MHLKRGVYTAPYRIDGCEVLCAIKSNGDRHLKIVVLRPGISRARAVRWLKDVLDRIDPVPQLRLLAGGNAPSEIRKPITQRITVEAIDELYRDASPTARALWHRKRARLARQSGRSAPARVLR